MLNVTHIRKSYGSGADRFTAVGDVDFQVADGEFVCIVGPSGCGKTTLLRCIAGLSDPDDGSVAIDGDVTTEPHPSMAIVFQEYGRSLFPWLTVASNVELPLRARGCGKAERSTRAADALRSVGLDGAGDRYPWQLSGGMQQRVAIARALAIRPRILLMDEPFASVDAQTREDLEDLLLDIRREFDMDILFITHDIDEAVYLADRVLVLSQSPTEIRGVCEIDLTRPRRQDETKGHPRFRELRTRVYRELRGVSGRQERSREADELASMPDESQASSDRSWGHGPQGEVAL